MIDLKMCGIQRFSDAAKEAATTRGNPVNLSSLRVLTLLAVPLLGVSGCTLINTDGRFGPGSACVEDDDCAQSCACTNNVCEPRHTTCSANAECGSGQFCLSGTCRAVPPGSRACTSSQQCGMDTCINGFCVRPCDRSVDCSTGQTCQAGFCGGVTNPDGGTGGGSGSATGGGSGSATGGGTGTGTGGGSTTDAGVPTICTYNADCGLGGWCVNNTCLFGCTADTDCTTGNSCQGGLCRPRPAGTCSNSTHCASAQDCVDGACRDRCASAATCGADRVCRIGYCLPPTQVVCTTNCDCSVGLRCLQGSCAP